MGLPQQHHMGPALSHNVTALTVADLDTNGQADVVASFATYGIWIYRNNTSWTFLNPNVGSRARAPGNSMAGRRPIS